MSRKIKKTSSGVQLINKDQVPWTSSSFNGEFYFKKDSNKFLDKRSNTLSASVIRNLDENFSKEKMAWDLIKDSQNPDDIKIFIESFPNSTLIKIANFKLKILKSKKETDPSDLENLIQY